MAKHRRTTALAHYSPPRPQLVVIRGGGKRRGRRSAGRSVGRRARRRVGRELKHSLPLVGLGAAGAVVGYGIGEGWFDRVPELGGSKTLGLAAAGYIATRVFKNKYVRLGGAAAVVLAGFEFGKGHADGSGGGGGKRGAAAHGWSGGGLGPFGGG